MKMAGVRENCSAYAVGEEVEVFVRSYVSAFVDTGGKWFRGCVDEVQPCGEGKNKTFFIIVHVAELTYGQDIGVYEGGISEKLTAKNAVLILLRPPSLPSRTGCSPLPASGATTALSAQKSCWTPSFFASESFFQATGRTSLLKIS